MSRLFAIRVFSGLLLVAATSIGREAAAIKIEAEEDIYLDFHALVQPQMQIGKDPIADPEFTTDFFLRRTRIILEGQVSKYVGFFLETDQPNWGKNGNWDDAPLFLQDAYGEFTIDPAFRLYAGMLIVPFVHQASQGAVNLHTLDYHGALVRYPAGSHKGWRDTGVGVRGLAADDHFSYRAQVTTGVTDKDHDVPRMTARLAGNVFDGEEKFFLGGTYLGKKKVLSFGAAVDFQPEAFNGSEPYVGAGGDVFLDIPFGEHRVSGQLDVVYYGLGDNPQNGWGALFDLGYAIGDIEPLIAVDYFMPEGSTAFSEMMWGGHVGLNYWLLGHNANIKADFGFVKDEGRTMATANRVATLQAQIFL